MVPSGSAVKNPATQETWVQFLGQEDPLEKGNPRQYSCLENPMDRGVWRATVHGVANSQTRPNTYARRHSWFPGLGYDQETRVGQEMYH